MVTRKPSSFERSHDRAERPVDERLAAGQAHRLVALGAENAERFAQEPGRAPRVMRGADSE